MKIRLLIYLITILYTSSFADDIYLDGSGWPKDLQYDKGTISIYQPQIEVFEQNKIEARAAIAIKVKGKAPVFGAMWFTSKAETDLDEREIIFNDLVVEALKFPEGEAEKIEKIRAGMTDRLNGLDMYMSLDRFTASIEHLSNDENDAESFNHKAPRIYYETKPAVLVFIDGEPILKEVENSSYQYVLNSPFFIVQNTKDKQFYLKGGTWWYNSNTVLSGWKSISKPPSEVAKLADKAFEGEADDLDSMTMQMDSPPKIIVSTEPAELIQTDGEAKFEPVPETDLLFLSNSESDIIMDIQSQNYYILISGRWYISKKLDGDDWKYIPPNDIPTDFAKIPKGSDIADVRYSVAGTQEAKDALLENSIPQTAEIDRKTATAEVSYDGNPKFTKIESTAVSYAENADKTVLLIDKKYYVVDDAVWFVSDKATGPWEVCVDVPDDVQKIPPESPVYNVKYVYVYDYTPSVVYVGYTPGYYGSYVSYGTVIYGTGYWYRPWYRTYYYPRPVTYGFGVHYNPWTGWGFSFGVSYGWMTFGWHSYHRQWWGPCGYRYGYRHGYYRGYRHGYRQGYAAGRRAGYVASNRPSTRPMPSNVYRNRGNGVRNTGTRPSTRPSNPGTRPSTRPANPSTRPAAPATGARPSNGQPRTRENNVYSDKNGNIYRRENNGSWQQRNNGQWNNRSNTRPNQGSPQNLNREYNNRNRGNQRTNNYSNRNSGRTAPRTAPRGGGGRRR